jgi:hypothetical protein
MFKYVELMRKSAFRIMSKTYGGKSKDANETIHDAYPLKSLARLLCFETLDEAREACRHYNITVKPTKIRSSSGISVEEIIFWRQSSFTEPKDEDKGTLILLPPQKMLRTIEGKLQGATRLAVCRGQVSGPGAFLTSQEREVESAIHSSPVSNARSFAGVNDHFQGQSTQGDSATLENQADAKFEEIRKLQLALFRQQTNEEAERTQEEARRIEEEEIRRKAAEEDARRKLEEESRKHEIELRRKQSEEERRRREENQKRILEAQQLEQERIERERELRVRRAREEESRHEQLRIEAEMKRERAEEEKVELKKKAEEAARQRQLEIDRQNRIRLQYEARRGRKRDTSAGRGATEERRR